MPLTPIKLLPARDRVAAALREAILTHSIRPGEELSLKDTAALLGVSVTPVREAFQILAREGLITLHPNRGALVQEITEKRIRDHYELRAILEREAAMAACRNGGDLSAVRGAYLQAEEELKRGSAGYSDLNQAFHVAIWTAGGNEKMQEMLSGLWNGLSLGYRVTQENYAQLSMTEHKEILQALEARDEKRAGELMDRHILRSMDSVLSHQLGADP